MESQNVCEITMQFHTSNGDVTDSRYHEDSIRENPVILSEKSWNNPEQNGAELPRKLNSEEQNGSTTVPSNGLVEDYKPAEWMSPIRNIPKYRLRLSRVMTPIHRWNLPGLPEGFQLSIKRDDLTGSTMSGNKIRKLDFLMAEAVANGCQHVITGGESQSNHCRTVTMSALELGMTPHLVLRVPDINAKMKYEGNMLLNGLSGCKMYLVQRDDRGPVDLVPRMNKLAQNIRQKTGERVCIVPIGGSDEIGVFGYIEVFREMIEQGLQERFDDVVIATCGLANSLAGLAIANYLTGSKVRCHGICVSNTSYNIMPNINALLSTLGLKDVRAEEILNIIVGYDGEGYGKTDPETIEFIQQAVRTTGILLDPVYTGKAARGMIEALNKTPELFKGKRILFIHTGGIFIVFDGRLTNLMNDPEHMSDQIINWSDENIEPFSSI